MAGRHWLGESDSKSISGRAESRCKGPEAEESAVGMLKAVPHRGPGSPRCRGSGEKCRCHSSATGKEAWADDLDIGRMRA